MSKIQISNLQAAGSELFQSSESFLTELQATEAHAVYGGKKSNKSRKNSNRGSNRSSNRGSNRNSNNNSRGNTFVFIPFPFYGYSRHC